MIEPDGPTYNVSIRANIVSRRLELLDARSLSPTGSLGLGTAYYGSIAAGRAVLYNNSPSPTRFIAVLDSQSPGAEVSHVILLLPAGYVVDGCDNTK